MQSNHSSPREAVFTHRAEVLFHKKNKCPFVEGESKGTTSAVISSNYKLGKYHLPRDVHDTCFRIQRAAFTSKKTPLGRPEKLRSGSRQRLYGYLNPCKPKNS